MGRQEGTKVLPTRFSMLCPPEGQHVCHFSSVQFSSVAQSCPTLCDPMNYSTPGLPFHHQLLEFTQTEVHRVRDAIQPSHPLSSPLPPAPNTHPPSIRVFSKESTQLFVWGDQSTGVSALVSFLPKNTQGWSPLERTGWISLQSKGLSRVFSNTWHIVVTAKISLNTQLFCGLIIANP